MADNPEDSGTIETAAYRAAADLYVENVQLRALLASAAQVEKTTPTVSNRAIPIMVGAIVTLSIVAVASIVVIFIVRPDKDNTSLIATIIGFLLPLVSAMLAATVNGLHGAVNGRLTQLLTQTSRSAASEARLMERARSHRRASDAPVVIAKLASPTANDVLKDTVTPERNPE